MVVIFLGQELEHNFSIVTVPPRLPITHPLCLRRDPLSLGRQSVAELVAPTCEYLIEIILVPADIRVKAGELPDAVDLAVPMHVRRVGVALDGDLRARGVRVALVRHAQLVRADDLGVRDLLPLGAADEVLRLEQRVAEDGGRGDHGDVLFGRHRLPELVQEGAVVNLFGR